MKKLLYIDACIRDENSRTKRIAQPVIEALGKKYDIETIVLNELELVPANKETTERKNNGEYSVRDFCLAKKVSEAERIVIAAPFWDMSFPAALKTFLEHCSIIDVTFKSDDKTCYGICRAEKLLYITTRGMNIKTGEVLEQATPYIKALAWLWGIGKVEVLARENFDYMSADEVDEQIDSAISEGIALAETF